jgi:hypothetical protein
MSRHMLRDVEAGLGVRSGGRASVGGHRVAVNRAGKEHTVQLRYPKHLGRSVHLLEGLEDKTSKHQRACGCFTEGDPVSEVGTRNRYECGCSMPDGDDVRRSF